MQFRKKLLLGTVAVTTILSVGCSVKKNPKPELNELRAEGVPIAIYGFKVGAPLDYPPKAAAEVHHIPVVFVTTQDLRFTGASTVPGQKVDHIDIETTLFEQVSDSPARYQATRRKTFSTDRANIVHHRGPANPSSAEHWSAHYIEAGVRDKYTYYWVKQLEGEESCVEIDAIAVDYVDSETVRISGRQAIDAAMSDSLFAKRIREPDFDNHCPRYRG